jgi:putative transposase
METRRNFDQFRMSDEMWERLKRLLPEYATSPLGGRPRADLRAVADAIFYRMRTGCQWQAIPPELTPGSTAHDYFQEWTEQGVFEQLWQVALEEYDDEVGLDWEWQSLDGAMTKAPLGGENTGKNPTDRGKSGTKRSLQTEAAGVPVGLAVAGANVHDKRLVKDTIDNTLDMAPAPEADAAEIEEHLCLDKGYDYGDIRELIEGVYQYTSHVRSRGEEIRELDRAEGEQARRWVVERTHGWLNRFRAILIRWEKKTENHLAVLHLGCAYYTLSLAGVFG